MTDGLVRVERAENITTVTLESLTMTPRFFQALGEAFGAVAADREVRAVIVAASGKAFSYGLDLREAMAEQGELIAGPTLAGPRTELLGLIRKWQASVSAVADCPVPVIAAIHGWCIGGGLDLAAACDLRLCTSDARFSLRETRLAMVADLGSLQRLPAIVGQGYLRELAFTGRDVGAPTALARGLVNAVYADRAALEAGARALAAEIAANPPLAVRGVKEVLAFGEGKAAREGLAYVAAWNAAFLASEDLGEAMGAFAEKRAPRFRGR
ncbi:MAG TPA: crotonase/enoyl-CoA hydratase family protein [Myxococcota bacterium]|nr:crotonase/enoyl-CoA hydratase family protein [Myxococcota bacterium]